MKRNQESVADYYEMAKEIAKVELSAGIENWVRVSIERQVAAENRLKEKVEQWRNDYDRQRVKRENYQGK